MLLLLVSAQLVRSARPALPVMGYSNWYDTKCDVHAARFLEAADALERTGLRALGYTQINVDAGWALPARHATTHELVPDPRFFPSGMAALAAELGERGFSLGGYTDRGTQQCGPSPGSKGFEALDAETFARWNLSYVKSDDCYANLTFAQGMADYEKFGAALRAAGNGTIYYLICGCKLGVGAPDPRAGWEQCPAEASRAGSTITAWRIASDDYTWSNVLVNANINAGLTAFSRAGKFNDPDMLINQPLVPAGWPSAQACPNLPQWKTVRGHGFPPYSITRLQARLQLSLWCVMAAPLILSLNVRNLSAYDLETYTNVDAVAIDQDPLVLAGVRLRGGNLTTTKLPPPPPPPPPPLPPAPPGTREIVDYNVVDGQCAACKISASGCCFSRGKPNPAVQYLSHHNTTSLAACEALCRAFLGGGGGGGGPAPTPGVGLAMSHPTNPPGPAPGLECHSWVWNTINRDCFGRLDTVFDANNPEYRQPGIDSGTFLSTSTSAGTPSSVADPGPGLSHSAGAAAGVAGHPAPLRRARPARRPRNPLTGNFSTTNIWGKRLNGGGFALLFLNVGPATSPPMTCDAECIEELGVYLPAGQRFRVRDVWGQKDLGMAVAPFRLTSPPLETDAVHFVRVSRLE